MLLAVIVLLLLETAGAAFLRTGIEEEYDDCIDGLGIADGRGTDDDEIVGRDNETVADNDDDILDCAITG